MRSARNVIASLIVMAWLVPTVSDEAGEKLIAPNVTEARRYVNWSAELVALVPPGVVTVTSTAPAAPAGDTAVICVADFTVKLVAFAAPNFTAVAAVRLVPVMVTLVPPLTVPLVGATPVTVGAGGIATVNVTRFDSIPPHVSEYVYVPGVEGAVRLGLLAAGELPAMTPVQVVFEAVLEAKQYPSELDPVFVPLVLPL